MIPRTTKLCEYLRNPVNEKDGISMFSGVFSHWHGLRDGLFGLLDIRLKKEGPLAVQHSCASGIPQILIDLLTGNITEASSEESNFPKDQIGLSPIGVPWSISLLCQCLTGGVSTFRHIFLKMEHAKFISYLILDVHLKLVKSWSGPGGRADGVRDTINTVIDLLAFPFVAVQNGLGLPSATASVNSGFLLNVGSPGGRVCPEDKDMIKAIESHLGKYTQILLEIGNAAYHNELLYDELRRSIPQLSYLLLSAEEDKTKANAAGALSNLVRNSNKLCEDIVSKGAMQVLLKLVTDCSVVALSLSRKDTINESPLKIALFSLAKMCAHPSCGQFLCTSELFPVVRQLQQSPESTIANYASVIVKKVAEVN